MQRTCIAWNSRGGAGAVSRRCQGNTDKAPDRARRRKATTRGHVHWVVTEYGAVNLHGMSLRERAAALISIAHPDFRAELTRDVARIRGRVE